MGGMGQKINFGGILSRIKSNMIRLPVMSLVNTASKNLNEYLTIIDAQNDNLSEKKVLSLIKKLKPEKIYMATSEYDYDYEQGLVHKMEDIITDDTKIIFIRGDSSAMDLDDIPFWPIFNYSRYRYFPFISRTPVLPVIASQGCPFACSYCSYSQNMGKKWIPKKLSILKQELEDAQYRYKAKGIVFRDPLFTFDKRRTHEICDILKRLDLHWTCETRPELLDHQLIAAMAEAGCKGINMGVESIDPLVLKNVGRKPVDKVSIKSIVNSAETLGIRTTLFFIFGLPGSSKEKEEESIKFAIEANPSHADFKIATPYSGTKLYQEAKKKGWITNFRGHYATMQANKDLPPEYLEEQCKLAFKRFYFRWDYIKRELGRHPLSMAWMVIKSL
jgi:radical SAM superfamily enzyme YgiQ (UPF0313 family)